MNYYTQPSFNTHSRIRRYKGLAVKIAIIVLAFLVLATFQWVTKFNNSEIIVNNGEKETFLKRLARILPFNADMLEKEYIMPDKEKNRLDFLILGVRGKDDPDGGLLTDTIIVFSFDKETKHSSLVSIPRDFFIRIDKDLYDKINSAYERIGLKETKKLISKITGIYIDHAIVFDFSSFKQIIDTLEGIDIYLEQPFEETTQWGYVFMLPEGENHLNGEDALYYVRSRFSTSDFDRAQRQQKVILALKEKIENINFLSDPEQALELMLTVRDNIQTDINLFDIKDIINLVKEFNGSTDDMQKHVLTTENFFYESRLDDGMYILLPNDDSFAEIKKFFKNLVPDGSLGIEENY